MWQLHANLTEEYQMVHFSLRIVELVLAIAGVVVGVASFAYAIKSEHKHKGQLNAVHTALVNLKPAIQGGNQPQVIAAINNMLESLTSMR
jgi:hypothetical protein